ncbi:hypothetical protein EG240_06600 [Paenimyroides tangerinum]|uniref:Uncharacterized protein n=1 Tax=Paenimyroides tangerinum TaxID=2488728 RepID=A0A3P3WC23_9FLAO|nr:hypothetical protein [Paenimyroides tangerinum]RRJ91169.1 hypothetical protein EG240_06600 [Paenimyroides tangerinum]
MKLLYSLLLIILIGVDLKAQTNGSSNQDLDQLVIEYNALFFASKKLVEGVQKNSPSSDKEVLLKFIDQNENLVNKKASNLTLNGQNSISNIGLKWVSDFTHNFGLGGSDDEDIYFRSKVSTGLDWVILGEGSYFKHKNDLKLNQIENRKDSLELVLFKKSDVSEKKIETLKYIFDIQRIELLKKFAEFLKAKVVYTNNLFEAKLINLPEKLKIQNDYSKINNHIELSESYLSKDDNQTLLSEYGNIPNIDLDVLNIEKQELTDLLTLDSEIIELQKELIRKDRKNSDRPSLRTRVRYNVFNSEGAFNRSFASVGASLSVPIRFGKDQALEYKIESFDAKLELQRTKAKERLEKLHYDFYFQKNELKNLQNDVKYIEALIENETQVYEKHILNFSPEKYIDYSMQLLRKKLEILDVNQSISEYFVTYQLLSAPKSQLNDNVAIETILEEPIEIPLEDKKLAVATSTYLWSDTFKAETNQSLIEALNKNNIKMLFLSPGESNQEKLKDFVVQAKQNQVEVHRLIGENSYAKNQLGIKKLIRKINHLDKENFTGIHLDIEPHTFSDYRENIDSYVENMNTIFTLVNQWCEDNDVKLSVSVPMNLTEKNAKVLKKLNIKTYIMAYENVDQKKLLKRTEKLRNILKENFVWVLRLSDFENVEILNTALNELHNHGITEISYYDLSVLLNKNE